MCYCYSYVFILHLQHIYLASKRVSMHLYILTIATRVPAHVAAHARSHRGKEAKPSLTPPPPCAAATVHSSVVPQEVERLKESGEAQAAGAKAMLKESHARGEEAVARLQLLETSSARDVALAKYEVIYV